MAPQIIYLTIIIISVMEAVYNHGEKIKERTHNGWMSLIAKSLLIGTLYWGGFFDVFIQ